MKEDELKEIFLAEALESYEELNKQFIALENDHGNKKAIDAIFRITHTLKANAAGMGYTDISSMAHTLEDVFSEIRTGKLAIEHDLFSDLFRANDIFGTMLLRMKDNSAEPVKYRGIKTKLEVLVRTARFGPDALPEMHVSPVSPLLESYQTMVDNGDILVEDTQNQEINNEGVLIEELVETAQEEVESKVTFSDLVQIPIRKLDNLMNLVGELIIERDRVVTALNGTMAKSSELSRIQRISSDLQYSVMDVRLVQVNVLFNKFHRIVRDTAELENKKINLVLEGTENEIDRNILQIISDSLVHIVRNAISHGIETTEERIKAGKSSTGNVIISATSEKDAVIISVKDDGKGINPAIIKKKVIEKGLSTKDMMDQLSEDEIIQFIFEPGFSSVDQVTAVSGRGVGMDVVKRSIDSIGGKVIIETKVGKGSTFNLILPSSMALKAALLFELGPNEYAIPLSYTEAVIQLQKSEIHQVSNGLVATHLDKTISVLFLNDLLKASSINDLTDPRQFLQSFHSLTAVEKLNVIVVSYGNRYIGIVVDKLLQQKEIVEKPLVKPLDNTKFISGATILGSGNVCLVLDIPGIVNYLFKLSRS